MPPNPVSGPVGLLSVSHFELFGLPEKFDVGAEELDKRHKLLQEKAHPDRHVGAGPAQRRHAEQLAAKVNAAYKTLSDPLARAAYLLSRAGSDPFDERNSSMPADFLEEQLELREMLEDADGDARAVRRLHALLSKRCAEGFVALGESFARGAEGVDDAVGWAKKLKYLGKLKDAAERAAHS